jgi:hypothetical protein
MKVLIINESIFKSIIKDGITFTLILFGFWFNCKFLGNSVWLEFCMSFAFIILLVATGSKINGKDIRQFENISDSIYYLQDLKDKEKKI